MRICDRCKAPAVDIVSFQSDDQKFDLCLTCREIVLDVINMKPSPAEEQKQEEKPAAAKRKKSSND